MTLPSPHRHMRTRVALRRLSACGVLGPVVSLWHATGTWLRRIALRLLWPSLTYCQDGLATEHNGDFLYDPRFTSAYALGRETGSWRGREIPWRAYVACWAAEHASRLPGDMVECGVYRGGLARTVMAYITFETLPKTFYLLDTFCGIPEEQILLEERRLGRGMERYEECYQDVVQTFKRFPNVVIIRGPIPDTLTQVPAEQICYLSLDMNSAMAEVAALNYFWEKLVSGAVVLLDDYGFRDYAPQKQAIDTFATAQGERVLSLPTGQGLIIRT